MFSWKGCWSNSSLKLNSVESVSGQGPNFRSFKFRTVGFNGSCLHLTAINVDLLGRYRLGSMGPVFT